MASHKTQHEEEVRLDFAAECIWRGASRFTLKAKAFAVLRYLAEHPGRVIPKDELLQAVWPGIVVSEWVLTTCVREIRRALHDDAKNPRFIETAHRRGYRWLASLRSASPVPSSEFQVQSSSPTPSPQHPTPLLVGRDTELSQLHQWLDKALKGERQLVFVTGEPGIGKTTLVETFLQSLASSVQRPASEDQTPQSHTVQTLDPRRQTLDASPWIGRGQCIEYYGAGEAYMPVLEALGRLCRGPEGDRLVALLSNYAPTWLAQMPALLSATDLETLQRKVQGATRERMLREMAEAIEALTAVRPLILWLEDLQWSDVSTLDLLSVVAQRPEHARLLVIGTYRPVEILANKHPLRAVKQTLQLHGQCEELRLALLTEAHVTDYLTTRLAERTQQVASLRGLAKAIHQRTDGNPLFLVNVIDYLSAQGMLGKSGELHSTVPIEIPENIQQMIEKQIDRLTPEEQHVLEVASVAGVQFSAAAVAAGTETTAGEVEACCTRLARREQFLRTHGVSEWPDGTVATRYSFLHALYQEVLYERVPAGQRTRLHKRIGEREEQAYGDQVREIAAELAMHFERGRDYRKAVRYLGQAGENAGRRSAHAEAMSHLTKGLELLKTLPDTPESAQQELMLQGALGIQLIIIKGIAAPEVERAFTRALALCRQVGETPELFPVLRGLVVFYLGQGKVETAREVGEQLLRLAQSTQDPDLLLEGHYALGATLFCRGEFIPARSHLEQVMALYDPQQHRFHAFRYGIDPGVLGYSYAARILWLLGYPDQAVKKDADALALAQELSHPFSLTMSLGFSAFLYQLRREAQVTQERATRTITLSTEQGFENGVVVGTFLQSWARAAQGHGHEEFIQRYQNLTAFQAMGLEAMRPYFLALLAEVYRSTGQPQEGLRVLAEALAVVDQTSAGFYEAELYRLKGELLLAQAGSRLQAGGFRGKTEEAERCFLQAIAIAQKQQAKSLELRAVVSLSRLWQQQGKKDKAKHMLAEIYGWFTEGFDTKDLREAKALLQELS
jgi:predicted ATPase/DNA-binding winged helix-turn-helix (wHTH) protein